MFERILILTLGVFGGFFIGGIAGAAMTFTSKPQYFHSTRANVTCISGMNGAFQCFPGNKVFNKNMKSDQWVTL